MRKIQAQAELVRNVMMYFDNALDKADEQELLQTLEQDPNCSELFQSEKSFREFLKNKVPRRTASPQIIHQIKEKINAAAPA